MINFSVIFGIVISLVVLFLLSVLVLVIKDIVVSKYGEDVGLWILVAGTSALLIILSMIQNRG